MAAVRMDAFAVFSPLEVEESMARRRLQQNGDLYVQGGWWKLRWREDQVDRNGRKNRGWSRPVVIGPAEGPRKFTQKEARRIAWDSFLSRQDQNNLSPHSIIKLSEFVEKKFMPEHVALLKKSGQIHYRTTLQLILPELGSKQLRDIAYEDIQRLVSSFAGRKHKRGNYSTQTQQHVRNAVSAIFTHAKKIGWWKGDNPASAVELPEMVRKELHALTFAQASAVLEALPPDYRCMILAALLTSMNVAEICGLTWKCVNLTAEWTSVNGEALPPFALAVRWQWRFGQYGSLKKKSRKRNLPLPAILLEELATMKQRSRWTGPDDPVFVGRTGKPLDGHNIANRHLKPIGKKLDMPWLSWHCFRRSHTTLADQLEMSHGDRMAMLGHRDPRMTMHYTQQDLTRRRELLDRMAARLMPVTGVVQ